MQVQIHMELIIFVGPILGHEDLFVYFYIFKHKILQVKNDHLPTS